MQYANDGEERRNEEMLAALFSLVMAGDIRAAQANIGLMAMSLSGHIGELAAQAHYDRHRPYTAPDLAPFTLPVPGHEPGMTLSGVAFGKSRK